MKNKGFSFVELLVAVAILGIISLPIASSFVFAAKVDAKATAASKAANAADDVLLLLTEMDQMPKYPVPEGEDVESGTYGLEYYLKYFAGNIPEVSDAQIFFEDMSEIIEAETEETASDVSSEAEQIIGVKRVFQLQYNGYPVELALTEFGTFFRVDITLTYYVDGNQIQITRKGVLEK